MPIPLFTILYYTIVIKPVVTLRHHALRIACPQCSLELLTRRKADAQPDLVLPAYDDLVSTFSGFYFGPPEVDGSISEDPAKWTGHISNEPLLVDNAFFVALRDGGVAYAFVSGAEPPSVKFVLEARCGLADPKRIAMGMAPDKPHPEGLLRLAEELAAEHGTTLDDIPSAYIGDTVGDVMTVLNARKARPGIKMAALAVPPPHVTEAGATSLERYRARLMEAGADHVVAATRELTASRVLELLGC